MSLILPGYVIDDSVLYDSMYSVIWTGHRIEDDVPVVIKLLKDDYPSLEENDRFKREYEITRSLHSSSIVKAYALEKIQNKYAIILERIDGIPLGKAFENRSLEMKKFLTLAIKITEAIGEIHQQNVVHNDINPTNILYIESDNSIKIIDFGLSMTLKKEWKGIVNPNFLLGTLPYMSPEQTGRMNRGVDYRTDFYSLGVTFYQLLTQRLPFGSKDPMELIHGHIAITPKSPNEINLSVPKAVSAIVMKLLAKNAEDRYLNAKGIKEDLSECVRQLEFLDKITPFTLGSKDVPNRFQITEKLYGREKEVGILLSAFERALHGKVQLMLVSGYSGIGKSSLVNEIQKPIIAGRGYFVSGKYDLYRHNLPYSALAHAFSELIKLILTESREVIENFRTKILAAVRGNGQLIIDLIPNVALIIGHQLPVVELGPTQNQNRLSVVFQNFVTALADADHPLALFLDDLQWADLPSLRMIDTLLSSYESHLLIIGAFRNNEVGPSHPLMGVLENLRKSDIHYDSIELGPLKLEDIQQLLIDTLHSDKEAITPLAEICYKKTEGNPFFLIQVLETFYEENLIEFDGKKNRWAWNLEQIQAKKITDNVVELLLEKIYQLSPRAQKVLELAACIGNHFDISILDGIYGQGREELMNSLQEVLQAGFIIGKRGFNQVVTYQFAHDRIQQAAHSMLEERDRKKVHLDISHLLLRLTPEGLLQEEIFDIVDHFNLSADPEFLPSVDSQEKRKMALLNLKASKLAKSAAAYGQSLKYAEATIKCLGENGWKEEDELSFNAYAEATESALLNGNLDLMNHYATVSLEHVKGIYDEIRINRILISSLNNQSKYDEVINLGIKLLAKLGTRFPLYPTKAKILLAIVKVKFLLSIRRPSTLLNLPPLANPRIEAIHGLINAILPGVFLGRKHLFPILISESLTLSMKYGNSKYSAFAYTSYGTICCGILGELEKGYQLGDLGENLIEKTNDLESKTRVIFGVYGFIKHWKDPIKDSLVKLRENYVEGLNRGDPEFSFYSICIYSIYAFASGVKLPELAAQLEAYTCEIRNLNTKNFLHAIYQAVINLTKDPSNEDHLVGEKFNEDKLVPQLKEEKKKLGLFTVFYCKLQLAYTFENYLNAQKTIGEMAAYEQIGHFANPSLNFYSSLTLLALYKNSTKKEKVEIERKVKMNQKIMKKWINFSAKNHAQKYALVEAEWMSKVMKRPAEAVVLYQKAIMLANQKEFLQEEALGYELLSKHYIEQGDEKLAKVYLKDARQCYLLWGAIAKVTQLDRKYSRIRERNEPLTSLHTLSNSTIIGKTISSTLDISTIQKCSQAISSTIVITDLLKNLMRFMIENAGAEKGYFLINREGQFFIEAKQGIGELEANVLQSTLITHDVLPETIINYVINTQESVVLDNGYEVGRFVNDPYIVQNHTKSILCIPLMNQGKMTGLLYLENNLTEGAFTQNRIDLLNLVSSQIAISIDNARLYANMIELNLSYERFVPKDFLNLLNKKSIKEVGVGDHVERKMTVLFTDIRNFTALSEKMTPEENFTFINAFLNLIAPIISKHRGFIDKYIGDAIMALYPERADDAVRCALEIQHVLKKYNETTKAVEPIRIGIGINTGLLMLGTVGEENRLGATVISDAVNVASRVESLTKVYNANILITEDVVKNLESPEAFSINKVADSQVKGKSKEIAVYSVTELASSS